MAYQAIQVQKIFLSSPIHWDVWLKAVKTQALAKEIWNYVDPDGNGPIEPAVPKETTLESFIARYGIIANQNEPENAI